MAQGRKTELRVRVSPEHRRLLESWQRGTKFPAGVARRGRLILLLADGVSISEAARRVGIARRLVYKWADRFRREGPQGLFDAPRPGRPPSFSPRGAGSCRPDRVRAA